MARRTHNRSASSRQTRGTAALALAVFESLERRQLLVGSPPFSPSLGPGFEPDELLDAAQGSYANQNLLSRVSSGSVRYFDGAVRYAHKDLSSGGFGIAWGHTRGWTNSVGHDVGTGSLQSIAPGQYGNGWVLAQLPYLVETSSTSTSRIAFVSGGSTARYFDETGVTTDVYAGRLYMPEKLEKSTDHAGAEEFRVIDSTGRILRFYGFSTSLPTAQQGAFKSITDPGRNHTWVAARDPGGRATDLRRRTTTPTGSLWESYRYYYDAPGPNTGKLSTVVLRRSTEALPQDNNPAHWTIVRQVAFDYYGLSDANGTLGDLKNAVARDPGGVEIETSYYRYYTGPTFRGSTQIGYAGALKFVFGPEASARLRDALGVASVDAATDLQVQAYADHYFEFDAQRRVSLERIAASGGVASPVAGHGEYKYTYTTNSYVPPQPTVYHLANSWKYKTIETLPDNSVRTVYMNNYGQVMVESMKPTGSAQEWVHSQSFDIPGTPTADDFASVTRHNYPSNHDFATPFSNFVDGLPGTIHTVDGTGGRGHVLGYSYASISVGAVSGFLTSAGASVGADFLRREERGRWEYRTRTVTVSEFPIESEDGGLDQDGGGIAGSTSVTRVDVASATCRCGSASPVEEAPLPSLSIDRDWEYTYTFYGDDTPNDATDDTLQPKTMGVRAPSEHESQNGSGLLNRKEYAFDPYGRATWMRDGPSNSPYIHYTGYDPATGAVFRRIDAVNIILGITLGGYDALPSGWTSSAIGLNAHVRVDYEVDAFGRVTARTEDPLGTPRTTYAVYDDLRETSPAANDGHEIRVYPGWQSGTSTTTGPIQVYRKDASGTYTEMLTMTANLAGHVAGGRPLGTEDLAAATVHTLTRAFVNAAGQQTQLRTYFNLSGLSYTRTATMGTLGTNYYAQDFGYDLHGRRDRTVNNVGTITRDVFDGQSRLVERWSGTDDSGWIPSASHDNMRRLMRLEYDGNAGDPNANAGVGNGHLTRLTVYPDGENAPRDTRYYYDALDFLRMVDRTIDVGGGSNPKREITFLSYDNRGPVSELTTYDATGFSVQWNTDGPARPAASGRRTSIRNHYDGHGRVFRTDVYRVAPDGSLPDAHPNHLQTNYFYDEQGNLMATRRPGGLAIKRQFDGAGRLINEWTTDAGGDPAPGEVDAWKAANPQIDSLLGDTQLRFVDFTYDGSSNVIATSTTERSHNGIGRTSYVGFYYDAANRTQAAANLGTNGGVSWNRVEDEVSPVALVTVNTYNAAGWLDTRFDAKGNAGKFFYDNLGRVVKTVEAYTGGGPSRDANRTTQWTYNGNSDVTSMTATNVDDTLTLTTQTTTYTYGVATLGGHTVNSNDLLASIEYPSTGVGVNRTETFLRNALGEAIRFTDRNGTTHAYQYDGMGRLVEDDITVLGSGVAGQVRKLTFGFDSANRPSTFTSWGKTGSQHVVANQVKREYNPLGQVGIEYQAHLGEVVPGSTPVVQYTFSERTNGTEFVNHSRPTSTIYPDGRTLTYQYTNTQLNPDDTISRLSAIHDSGIGMNAEEYSYLGLSTIVRRYRPEPRTELTYIKQAGESNGDGGDQYTGLDRFGRIVDQRWLRRDASGQIIETTDRFKYGYDKNSNRLYRDNVVTDNLGGTGIDGFDELYHANGPGNGFDPLDRLTSFARGTLDATKTSITGTATRSQSWNLDALGNMAGVTTNGSTQTRSHNDQNRMTAVSGQSAPTYDANGNMLTDGTNAYTYDAWNRLTTATAGGREWGYDYDALNRRIVERSSPGTVSPLPPDTHLYYDTNWRVLQEVSVYLDGPHAGEGTAVANVWSAAYIDALVLRDTTSIAGGGGANALIAGLIAEQQAGPIIDPTTLPVPGGQSQSSGDPGVQRPVPPAGRIYVQQDANFNTTSITDETGAVRERYVYDPYGRSDALTAGWTHKTGTAGFQGDYAFVQRFQGLRLDLVTANHHARNRDLNGRLSVWNTQDPIGYVDGGNRYQLVGSSPTSRLDPNGLFDMTLALDLDLVPIFGGELTLGWVLDTDSPLSSGLFCGYGLAGGGSVGAGIVGGFNTGDIEGQSLNYDINVGKPQGGITVNTDGSGWGLQGGAGLGGGASCSVLETQTLDVVDAAVLTLEVFVLPILRLFK